MIVVVLVTVGFLDEHDEIGAKEEYDDANVEARQELESMLMNDLHENYPRLRLTIYVQEANELKETHDGESVGEKGQDDNVDTDENGLDDEQRREDEAHPTEHALVLGARAARPHAQHVLDPEVDGHEYLVVMHEQDALTFVGFERGRGADEYGAENDGEREDAMYEAERANWTLQKMIHLKEYFQYY